MEPFDKDMSLSRPYLIRAIYQWIIDNDLTPYLLVDCSNEYVEVPTQYIQDGKIVLNIGLVAASALVLGDDSVSFSARFAGKVTNVYVPILSALAIYAKENGQGIIFSSFDKTPPEYKKMTDSVVEKPVKKSKPSLKIVK